MEWFKTVLNKAKNVGEIFIYGQITDEKWYEEDVTPGAIKKDLEKVQDAKAVNLYINSPGGGVFAGMTIYHLIKRLPGAVTTHVDGIAASIASVIAMAGKRIVIPENAMMMIHDPMALAAGTSEEMREVADMLDRVKTAIVSTYRDKTGKAEDEIAALMSAETWMDGKRAVEMGFADATGGAAVTALASKDSLTINGVAYKPKNYKSFPSNQIETVRATGGSYRENKHKQLHQQLKEYL